jgi:hypothetical protein
LVALNHFTVPLAIVRSPLVMPPAGCGGPARSADDRELRPVRETAGRTS